MVRKKFILFLVLFILLLVFSVSASETLEVNNVIINFDQAKYSIEETWYLTYDDGGVREPRWVLDFDVENYYLYDSSGKVVYSDDWACSSSSSDAFVNGWYEPTSGDYVLTCFRSLDSASDGVYDYPEVTKVAFSVNLVMSLSDGSKISEGYNLDLSRAEFENLLVGQSVDLSYSCSLDSDCFEKSICVDSTCFVPCTISTECDSGEACDVDSSSSTYGTCVVYCGVGEAQCSDGINNNGMNGIDYAGVCDLGVEVVSCSNFNGVAYDTDVDNQGVSSSCKSICESSAYAGTYIEGDVTDCVSPLDPYEGTSSGTKFAPEVSSESFFVRLWNWIFFGD